MVKFCNISNIVSCLQQVIVNIARMMETAAGSATKCSLVFSSCNIIQSSIWSGTSLHPAPRCRGRRRPRRSWRAAWRSAGGRGRPQSPGRARRGRTPPRPRPGHHGHCTPASPTRPPTHRSHEAVQLGPGDVAASEHRGHGQLPAPARHEAGAQSGVGAQQLRGQLGQL